jgi:hypothetical protein
VLSPITSADASAEAALFSESMLVLSSNAGMDLVVAIPIEVRRKKGRCYYRAPRAFSQNLVKEQLEAASPRLSALAFSRRATTQLTDDELNARYRRKGEADCVQVIQLKLRWAMLRPLVMVEDRERLYGQEERAKRIRARAEQILADPTLSAALDTPVRRRKTRAGRRFDDTPEGKLQRLESELQRLLFQFWAGGSTRGALIGFSGECGGRGKSRKVGTRKRGRPSAAERAGGPEMAGLSIEAESEHAKRCEFCHHTWVVRGTTEAVALHRMWDEFYSTVVQQPNGQFKKEWLPPQQRPTASQFRYWGTKNNRGDVAWRKQLPPNEFDTRYRALMGSASEDIYAIGQRGCIDSTPPDLQLVRAIDRLARLGGAHRIILVDSMFGFIPGFDLSLEAACATTVRLAVYCAADPDKAGWLSELGLDDIPPEDFLPMWFENLWADNTDLRCEEVMTCLDGIDTNVHYVPKYRSDRNGLVEAKHHVLHRMVDHRLSGTTHGRRKARGERSATDLARHTLVEAARETARAIHVHNTAELADDRPLRMRMKGVPPTRLAMTKEFIRLNRVARTLGAIDLFRRHCLPRWRGTFTREGVRLHRPGCGDKVEFIRHAAYVSNHRIITDWCELARRGGKHDPDFFRRDFIVNPRRPSRIWFLDTFSGEPVELTFKSLRIRDPDLPYVMTLDDMVDRDQVEGVEAPAWRDGRERKFGGMEGKQRESDANAQIEYDNAVIESGGEPTRSEANRNKRQNRAAERDAMLFAEPVPPPPATGASVVDPTINATAASETASARGEEVRSGPVATGPRQSLLAAIARKTATKGAQ